VVLSPLKISRSVPPTKSMIELAVSVSAPVPGEEPSVTSPLKAMVPPASVTVAALLIRSVVPVLQAKA
jgi:hypothetical protein